MVGCPFCKLDTSVTYNHIIEETDNFIVVPGIGALVVGYILIIPKQHSYSMTRFDSNMMNEYKSLLQKYREIYNKIYGKYPIIFEHGTPDPNGLCANCVIHAHTHLINHHYKHEKDILKQLNFTRIKDISDIQNKNYIYYKNPKGYDYVTYDYEPISQIMRIFISEDLGLKDQYNWRKYPFDKNIEKTVEDLENIVL